MLAQSLLESVTHDLSEGLRSDDSRGGRRDGCRPRSRRRRQIDSSEPGRPDRQQIIKGVTGTALAGQMLRLDVTRVNTR